MREALQYSACRIIWDPVNLRHLGILWPMGEEDTTRYFSCGSLYGALKTVQVET